MHATEIRFSDDQSGSKDQQTKGLLDQKPDDINSKMNKDQDNEDDDKDDEDDCKPSAQEKKQDDNDEDISDSTEES